MRPPRCDCANHLPCDIDLGFAATAKIDGDWSVERVLDQVSDGPSLATGSTSPLPFFHLLERLKTTQREGWRRFGISRYVNERQRAPEAEKVKS